MREDERGERTGRGGTTEDPDDLEVRDGDDEDRRGGAPADDERWDDPFDGFEVEDDGLDEASYERLHDRRQRRLTRQRAVFAALVVLVLVVGGVAALVGSGRWQPGGAATPSAAPSCTAPAAQPLLAPADTTVDAVLNGTTRRGLAGGVAGGLRERGFTVGEVGNAAVPAGPVTAVVRFPADREAQARAVAARFPEAQLLPDETATRLEVTVGDAYQQLLAEDALAAPPAPAPAC